MKEKNLGYISAAFMGVTLFAAIFLISNYKGVNGFRIMVAFIIINTIKDIIMHKLGFTFKGIGIKPMIIFNIILLSLIIIFEYGASYLAP